MMLNGVEVCRPVLWCLAVVGGVGRSPLGLVRLGLILGFGGGGGGVGGEVVFV